MGFPGMEMYTRTKGGKRRAEYKATSETVIVVR